MDDTCDQCQQASKDVIHALWLCPRFSDSNRSLNRKKKRFKVFEVKPESNHDDVIINLIIN